MHNSRFNVDKLNNIWIFAKYNLLKCQMYRKRREEMFNRLKLIIRNNELQKENEELYEELKQIDFNAEIHPNNRKRVERALNYYYQHGVPISSQKKASKLLYDTIFIA